MELLKINSGCESWNFYRSAVNTVIDAYNKYANKTGSKADLIQKIHEFEERVTGVEEKDIYLRHIDKICEIAKYDRVERKNVKVPRPNQFELNKIDANRTSFSFI